MINEGDKVKLKTGEVAFVSEVLEADVMYVAEVLTKCGVSIEHVAYNEIESIFVETEMPVAQIA